MFLCCRKVHTNLYYKERRQLKTFLTKFRSTLPLMPDPPVTCFWKWIGWKDYEVPKNRNLESVSAKNKLFLSPNLFLPTHLYSRPAHYTCCQKSREGHKNHHKYESHPSCKASREKRPNWPRTPLQVPLFSFLFIFYFLIITLILFVPIKDYYAHKLYEITELEQYFYQ
jgi:hypothetical protein